MPNYSCRAANDPSWFRPRKEGEVVNHEVPSWNQVLECLQDLLTLGWALRRCS